MAPRNLPSAHELFAIILILEAQLQKLDGLGAGIAAIHVSAAIDQLRVNLKVVNDNSAAPFDPGLIWQEPRVSDRRAAPRRAPQD